MTRTEFLVNLRKALSGNISSAQVQENLEYYEQYIDEEIRKGKSEEEILAVLGEPWILARTIIDASDGTDKETVYENSRKTSGSEEKKNTTHILGLDTWWKKLFLVFCILLCIVVIVLIVTGLIRIFLPVIVPCILVAILLRVFRRRR